MLINIKDVLTLDDDNEYVVISKTNYNNKMYYYLLDKKSNRHPLFCYEDKDELVQVNDNNLITELLPYFLEVVQKELDK